MWKLLGLGGLILLFPLLSVSQSKPWCVTDFMDSIAISHDIGILERRAELESFTKNYIQQKIKSDEVLIIPVVFHVLHKYGKERISIDQIERGLEIVNEDYKALNTDLSGVVNEFKDIIGTANVEFRLAQIDPDGNCTNGVNYYDTELTYMASDSLKYTVTNWNPESYLNVWTVTSIESGAAAWSHYPGVPPSLDGVVSIHGYIGNGHTLSHEIGHYLNLIHPWGSTNEPGLESNCNIDDNVEDTPNTMGSDGTCNFSQYTCGSLDNVQNIMDYSTCDAMFSMGQTDRMRAALNSSVGSRKNLWIAENLAKTGTQDGYSSFDCAPKADFSSIEQMVFQDESLTFQALNNGGEALSWKWEFENGQPNRSTLQNSVISFSEAGLFNVKLTAINDNGENILERENIVRVIDTLKGIIAPYIVDMEEEGFPYYPDDISKQWIFENKEEGNWELFKGDENRALRILNQENDLESKTSVITANINLADIPNPNYIYFDWAYAQRIEENSDELKVYISNNGGKNWILRFTKRGKSLGTNNDELISSIFVPTTDKWNTGELSLLYNKSDSHIQLKFEMISHGGNALYIDNLQIGTSLSGVNTMNLNEKLSVYPNPTSQEINIKYATNGSYPSELRIYNVLGSLVYRTMLNSDKRNNVKTFRKSDLNIGNGIFLVELVTPTNKLATRLVVTE